MTALFISMAVGLAVAVATYPTLLDWPRTHALSVIVTAVSLLGILALKFAQQLADLEREERHALDHQHVQCHACRKWTRLRDVRYWGTGQPHCLPCARAVLVTTQTPQSVRVEQGRSWPSDKDAA